MAGLFRSFTVVIVNVPVYLQHLLLPVVLFETERFNVLKVKAFIVTFLNCRPEQLLENSQQDCALGRLLYGTCCCKLDNVC
jgi:hypothetical protein